MSLLGLLASSGGDEPLYSSDVFSAYTYTGNSSTQTINNGIDLAGKGGLVWLKDRTTASHHRLFDTARGATNSLLTSLTIANDVTSGLTSFGSSGFDLGAAASCNAPSTNYVSWTFRRAAKFFDVVTYTGDGTSNRQIAHGLGCEVGMVIIKRTDSTGDWFVYSRGWNFPGEGGLLNGTQSFSSTYAALNGTTPSSTAFKPSQTNANTNGATYVCYLFAHDTSTDGIIQCGSFTTDASGNATVNLGWEPQYLMVKASSTTQDWRVLDVSRGWAVGGGNAPLFPNLSSAEGGYGTGGGSPTATGFNISSFSSSTTYIYLAIRRPNKPPTTGTQVYNAIARTGTGAAATVTGVGFAPDFQLCVNRLGGYGNSIFDKLRGVSTLIQPWLTSAEVSDTVGLTSFNMDGVSLGVDTTQYMTNVSGRTYINYFFKRAPGVFDQVCYTGTGSATTVSHGLGVAPELVIVKSMNAIGNWWAFHTFDTSTFGQNALNSMGAMTVQEYSVTLLTSAPTSVSLNLLAPSLITTASTTYACYLFASKAGISKVGSYTGNGTSQTINMGFTTGCRFFLVKATSTTGSWWVFDTTRGILAASDFGLQLNSTTTETTTADAVDVDGTGSGIIVNQEATCSINANGVSYIYLSYS